MSHRVLWQYTNLRVPQVSSGVAVTSSKEGPVSPTVYIHKTSNMCVARGNSMEVQASARFLHRLLDSAHVVELAITWLFFGSLADACKPPSILRPRPRH
ncbi:hypothetical protein GOP47_0018424 [Adiantum capillus-veneris]|uniref:Uncharacterized protein n=1 Tax=Adiantum capillus-veneris TaxID=13818 RepID=A0A9D4Z9J7_ADICA|nr:hypothetical protein GOP47_0018424 [Adiantum capillus-veneris]